MDGIGRGALALNTDFGIRATVVDFAAGRRFPIKTSRPLILDLLSDPKPGLESFTRPLQYNGKIHSRWIHLPANNMRWVQALMKKIYDERTSHHEEAWYSERAQDLLLRPDLWTGKQHRTGVGNRPGQFPVHARFMRPSCLDVTIDEGFSEAWRTEDNLILYMPYLGWEHSDAQKQMTSVIKDVYKNPKTKEYDRKLDTISRLSCGNDEEMLRADLHGTLPIHIRRTLDQYFYYNLSDTQARDKDQVVYRYTKTTLGLRDPVLVMVDQLWLWVIDGNLVISSFPQRWGNTGQREDRSSYSSEALDFLLTKLHKGIRPPYHIKSAYDIALMIVDECCGLFFDTWNKYDETLQFLEFFANSIGAVTHQQTECFEKFYANFTHAEKVGNLSSLRRNHSKSAYFQENGGMSETDSVLGESNASIKSVFDIEKETELLREIKDILDELNMLAHMCKQQLEVCSSLKRALKNLVKNTSPLSGVSRRSEISPAPIEFKDAIGRKYKFPFNMCKKWKDMEYLITEAFLHVADLGPHVADGHYDLLGPQHEIMLPSIWEAVIRPGWEISMEIWPLPELISKERPADVQAETVIVDEEVLAPSPHASAVSSSSVAIGGNAAEEEADEGVEERMMEKTWEEGETRLGQDTEGNEKKEEQKAEENWDEKEEEQEQEQEAEEAEEPRKPRKPRKQQRKQRKKSAAEMAREPKDYILESVQYTEPVQRAEELARTLESRYKDLKDLEDQASQTYKSLCDLLDLKQKQANIVEARSARRMAEQSAKQADAAAKQGRTVMLFTVVTIIFLPLSFISSVFGMNAREINGGPQGSSIPLGIIFAYMLPISFLIISFSLTLAFNNSVRDFYILQVRFFGYLVIYWTGLWWIGRFSKRMAKRLERWQTETLREMVENGRDD